MASATKYHAAPQRDSFDDNTPNYTQAPPSYQATASSHAQQQQQSDSTPFYSSTEPRAEDDNLPDDFKFGSSVAEATLPIRMQFVRKVYSILTAQLLATIALSCISYYSHGYKAWIQTHPAMMWVSLFGALGFMLLTFWKRKSYPMNLVFLSGFTALEAYSISVIVSFYNTKTVLLALVLTGGIFLALTLFACQTKYDFTSWMPYLFGSLWALILFGFVAAFFPYNSTAELIYGSLAALVFSGYILVDTQLVMRHYQVEEEIAAAISLYLDVINLFLAILRILNSQNNN